MTGTTQSITRDLLFDDLVKEAIDTMPDGEAGFAKTWGFKQFSLQLQQTLKSHNFYRLDCKNPLEFQVICLINEVKKVKPTREIRQAGQKKAVLNDLLKLDILEDEAKKALESMVGDYDNLIDHAFRQVTDED